MTSDFVMGGKTENPRMIGRIEYLFDASKKTTSTPDPCWLTVAEALSSELLLLALLLLTLLLALLLALLILLLLLVLNSSRLGSAKRRSLPSDSTCFIGVSGVVATELIVTDEALDRSFLPALDCCWKNDHQFIIISVYGISHNLTPTQ